MFSYGTCSFETLSLNELNLHTDIRHSSLKSWEPDQDTVNVNHVASSEAVELESAEAVNATVEDILDAVELVSTEAAKSLLQCNHCNFSSQSVNDLNIPVQIVHQNTMVDIKSVSILACFKCNYVCRLNIQLKKHMRIYHSNDSKFICNICSY